MLRRTLLAPVICLIIAGFIVASHSPLQARTTDKNIKPTDIARQHREKQAGQDAPDASVSQGATDKASQHKGSSTKPSVKKRKKSGTSQKAVVIHKKSARSTNHAKHAAVHSKKRGNSNAGTTSGKDRLASLNLPDRQPSDLWLAKDSPEIHRALRQEELTNDLDKLTLNILYSAYRYLGAPYRYGGTSPSGFDCSGFVQHVFGENGITLGRSSRDQAQEGIPVAFSELRPGDLIFFNMRPKKHNSIDHVGLYIGNGRFIHASSYRSREITIENLESGVFFNRLVGARRVLEHAGTEAMVIE